MKVLKHTIGNQEVYTTPDITIQLGPLKPTTTEELVIQDDLVNELFENPKEFVVKGNQLIDRKKLKK